MLGFALALPVLAQAPTPPPPPAPAALKPLGFYSQRFDYRWDTMIPLKVEVDGLQLESIFFNRREIARGPFKGADFGARAQVAVLNKADKIRVPGFAVAVFDAEGRLLGVASGGSKLGGVKPGEKETFDLNFAQVTERLPLGTSFVLSVELSD